MIDESTHRSHDKSDCHKGEGLVKILILCCVALALAALEPNTIDDVLDGGALQEACL